jgi:hypothetical protein
MSIYVDKGGRKAYKGRMENNLIACFANDTAGVILIQTQDEDYIVETVDAEGDCLAYSRVDNLQSAWYSFDSQKERLAA